MTKEQIEKHKIAGEKLDQIKNRAFNFIKKNIGKVSEYDVSQFILSEFKKQGLVVEKNYSFPIVAADKNSSFVHYFPEKRNSKVIKNNDLILMDMWAKLKDKDAPFADITWMGYCGKNIPAEIQKAFIKVIRARDLTFNFIRKNSKSRKPLNTKAIDKNTRSYFKKYALEKNFLHGTGHSLGINECHGKYFRFGKKTNSKFKISIPFTIEPGLYFKDKFGIRSEINCCMTEEGKLIITSSVQKEITKI